jgi:hypothetical protein
VNPSAPSLSLQAIYPPSANFSNLIFTGEPGPDVDTFTGNTVRQQLTFTRQ